jgi:release factor glutamine methyltransferase
MVDSMTQHHTMHSFHYLDLEILIHPEVYDPAEDTFLLLEALTITPNETVLELGTGCGLIALACAYKGCRVVCTDINPFAVRLVHQNTQRNRDLLKGSIEVRQGDLFSALSKNEQFDLIVFNPPYLPTSKKDRGEHWFDVATDGGRDGLRVTRRFIQGVKPHLLNTGKAYFIFSSLSPRLALEKALKNQGFAFKVSAHRRFEDEDLDVYCIAPVD